MKRNVWIVIWGLKDGGAETLAREYARLVDPERFETTLVTMYPFTDTANYRRTMEAGLRVLSIFKSRNAVNRAVRSLLGKWYIPIVLKKMLKIHKPDVIHFNDRMAQYFAPLGNMLSGVQLLYTCHNEVDKYFTQAEEAAVHELIQNPGLRLVALYDDMKQELNQQFEKNDSVVIRNGVDLHRYRETTIARKRIRQGVNIPEDVYVVGHVGRFSRQKNHAFLLRVFQAILKKKDNAHLLLIGSGDLQEEIRQTAARMQLQDRVTILSHRTDIPELLSAMDVMVFPSFFEGLSVVLVEAQASGLKCVISDTINPANHLLDTTIPVSLEAPPEVWANIVLDDTIRHDPCDNIDNFDMNNEIRRLERLYLGESDV